jgi:hypothetical protein
MEASAIMSHWSSRPMDDDMWGLPLPLHFLPNGSSRLLFGATTDRFILPAELRGCPRDTFPVAFFRRSGLLTRLPPSTSIRGLCHKPCSWARTCSAL